MAIARPQCPPEPVGAWADFFEAARPALARFESALAAPGEAQRARLRAILKANAATVFGREHGFGSIASVADYQSRVPVADWSAVEPWVRRCMAGEPALLTVAEPVHFECTSGSGAGQKHIPYTRELLREIQDALVVWLATLNRDCPAIAGPAYWALSPDASGPRTTPAGIPVGSASDASYITGSAAETLLPTVVSGAVSGDEACDWQLATLKKIAAEPELRLLSVWSPTFLLALLDSILDTARVDRSMDLLRQSLPADRYVALAVAIARRDFSNLWPRLQVISCWADGPSAGFAASLESLFPGARIVPKGLFATEGVVSLSWGTSTARPVAITSHFLEFVDDSGAAKLVDELEAGARYRPLLTTSGGLYRYDLGDRVEVSGHIEKTPCLHFVGRDDHRSDLVGEKLDERIVARALVSAGFDSPAVLVPDAAAQPPRYRLIVETDADAQRIEAELCHVHHYAIARRNRQLGPVSAKHVRSVSELLHVAWQAAGRRSGDAKAVALIASPEHAESVLGALRARGAAA